MSGAADAGGWRGSRCSTAPVPCPEVGAAGAVRSPFTRAAMQSQTARELSRRSMTSTPAAATFDRCSTCVMSSTGESFADARLIMIPQHNVEFHKVLLSSNLNSAWLLQDHSQQIAPSLL